MPHVLEGEKDKWNQLQRYYNANEVTIVLRLFVIVVTVVTIVIIVIVVNIAIVIVNIVVAALIVFVAVPIGFSYGQSIRV